ncbi:POLQ [Bugula neritina]|uniref:POLQ n=1 Tax=Bugula neritina TaxID=10212 RepID=A0A7J7K9X7_BUGNE|nr:POLQ [Bugula neritina]
MAMRLTLLSRLRESRLLDALTSLEMPHLACLSQMEVYGFGFDVAEFNRQTKLILDALNLIEKKCNSFTKRVFDLSSPKDIGEVLFVELHLPYERKKIVRRKGAPWSTCQAQLEKIKSLHPLPGLILLWRKLHSALKCLVQPLDKSKVWSEERSMYRIYSTCSIQTATGRITMHEPNLQTIRKDIALKVDGLSELSDSVVSLRNVFTASQGYTLLSADYSQLELRIISHLASDSVLIPLLNAGGDVFKDIASPG